VAGASRLAKGLVAGSVVLLGAVVLAGAAAPATARTFTISVDARDFAFSLSRRSVPAGSTVRFVLRNRGTAPHDFVVAGKKRTRVLQPGQRQTIAVSFPRKGTFRFLCSVSGHARLGMKGAFGVSVKPPATPPPAPPVDTSDLVSLTRVGSFERPVLATAPPGDRQRLFVVEHRGTVRVVRDGVVLPNPFLDIREQVTALGESGLLSIAFAPDYAASGLLYAFYNAREGPYGNLRITEFRVATFDPDRVDPSSQRHVLTIPKPYENHNGGMLQFGRDGDLYASVGDGDPGVLNRAGAFAQRLDVLLGNIVRIDPRGGDPYAVPTDNPFVAVPGARAEVWAYGLRNPWRFWIDPETNVLYVPDVGSTSREEINVVPRGGRGANFGWPCYEGTLVFDEAASCERPVAPLLDYPRQNGACAVIGGVVVRDTRLAALSGRYLYSDLCTGVITAIAVADGRLTASGELGVVIPELSSFGIDDLGRIHVMSLRGDVYRLDPRPAP
jgi:glucose/arabinose dehydrogenase